MTLKQFPLGGLDGIVLIHILTSIRSDVKIMANYLLSKMPQLKEILIPVDPFVRKNSIITNIKSVREVIRILKKEGMVCTFPAGEVAHFQLTKMKIEDPEWSPLVARMVRKTGAAVVPVCFHGCKSPLFHLLGLIHPRLRTVMLPREIIKKNNVTLKMKIGMPIGSEKLTKFSTDDEMISFLRLKTNLMKKGCSQKTRKGFMMIQKPGKSIPKALIEPMDPDVLHDEIHALSDTNLIFRKGSYSIF